MKHVALVTERYGKRVRTLCAISSLAFALSACGEDDDSTDQQDTSVSQGSDDEDTSDDESERGSASDDDSREDAERDEDSDDGTAMGGREGPASSGDDLASDDDAESSEPGESSNGGRVNPEDDESEASDVDDDETEGRESEDDQSEGGGPEADDSNPDQPGDDETGGSEGPVVVDNPLTNPDDGPPAGYAGGCDIPSEAGLEDVSSPDRVVGDGTPESCTADAFIEAVASGGVITFDCGDAPITITLDRPAKVFNDASEEIVIDGGGKVTLSGGGRSRILYMNTCDEAQHWTTSHCQDQDHPRLTVQNLTFIDADSKGESEYDGGGAIWVRGGRFKIVNSRFFNNSCAEEGPDVGGAAVRVFSQYQGQPVYVVNSTFGGAEGFGNVGSNGGGISSIDVSWTIINSLFTHNRAIGNGGNPAESGTPGGGSGGAIYNDGNTMTLSLCGTLIEHNQVNAYGSGIFFVSNDHSGTVRIIDSIVRDNTGGGWNVLPGISMHDDTETEIENSTIE